MANLPAAEKAARQAKRRKVYNLARLHAVKSAVKSVRKSLTEKNNEAIATNLSEAYAAIDKAAKRGIIKKNTASRKKSRLAKFIAKAQG